MSAASRQALAADMRNERMKECAGRAQRPSVSPSKSLGII